LKDVKCLKEISSSVVKNWKSSLKAVNVEPFAKTDFLLGSFFLLFLAVQVQAEGWICQVVHSDPAGSSKGDCEFLLSSFFFLLSLPFTFVDSQQLGSLSLKAWDLGGHEVVRELWQNFYLEANAILFLIDSADVDRFEEAKEELDGILNNADLKDVPVLVLANKIDVPVSFFTFFSFFFFSLQMAHAQFLF